MRFLPVENLIPGMTLGQDIVGLQGLKNYDEGMTLSAEDIKLFNDKGIFGIYVREEIPKKVLPKDLLEACLEAVNDIDVDAMIKLAPMIVNELIENDASLDFRSIRTVDDYVTHHSVCVAIYAVAIGIKLNMEESFLCDIALAGLLHDVGKSLLGLTPLEKKATLASEEFEQIKKHPIAGSEFVAKDGRILPLISSAILFHHENVNGTGYPNGVTGESIPLIARILHVADVYDAMMSKKAYKRGMSSADALSYLIGGKSILFDEQIVDVFCSIAVPYPTGIEVKLSTGDTGIVVKQSKNTMRPIIVMPHHRVIDLSNDVNYSQMHIVGDLAYLDHKDKNVRNTSTARITKTNPTVARKGRAKIMIVDDVYMSIAHTKRALGENYDIVYCKDGIDALRLVKSEVPDLILMDYEMPGMDGVSTTVELQKRGFNIPVIFLTGKGNKEIVCSCIKCGAVDYMLKPANPVYLQKRVEKALSIASGQVVMD